jgi:hypothetical protein
VRADDCELAAIAAPAPEEATGMPDQIIDAVMAHSIQADAAKAHVLFAWIILKDQTEYPGKVIARLATMHPTIYVMVADTLAEVQTMLPAGLERSAREMTDPSEIVEIWFGPEA